jgi:hypothetical protein
MAKYSEPTSALLRSLELSNRDDAYCGRGAVEHNAAALAASPTRTRS